MEQSPYLGINGANLRRERAYRPPCSKTGEGMPFMPSSEFVDGSSHAAKALGGTQARARLSTLTKETCAMNTMGRIDLSSATKIADEDNDDVTLAEIGGALCAMAAKLDQLGHAPIADELRVLGDHLACGR